MRDTDRFWSHVDTLVIVESNDAGKPCLRWKATLDERGYGQAWFGGKLRRAHRVAWELANGPIPDGLLVLHRCDNRACVNHEHLFLGTNADNSSDMVAKGRQTSGSKNARSTLKEESVTEIRSRLSGGETQRAIAEAFNVSRETISDISRRKTWRHLP